MIKIGPLRGREFKQVSGLLAMQDNVALTNWEISDFDLLVQSLGFWQHWLPCSMHIGPTVYVAREDSNVLGVICLQHSNRARTCWQVDALIVHPDHRGRGIAAELLRYAFAQFGAQGVSHFTAEVPAANDAALALFAACGFCRSSLVSFYLYNPATVHSFGDPAWGDPAYARLALPHMRNDLYQLYNEVLPPSIRQVLLLGPEDFEVKDSIPFTSVEQSRQKLMRNRVWYWVMEDADRRVITSCVKVTARPQNGYKLEFAVHPGWKQETEHIVRFAMARLLKDAPRLPVWVKSYDFQPELNETLSSFGFERTGESFLLCREHWVRARTRKRLTDTASLPLQAPAINFPLATDRKAKSN